MGFSPSGPVKANRGVRASVPAAGKVLEGDGQRTLSPLYYDNKDLQLQTSLMSFVVLHQHDMFSLMDSNAYFTTVSQPAEYYCHMHGMKDFFLPLFLVVLYPHSALKLFFFRVRGAASHTFGAECFIETAVCHTVPLL